MRVGGLITRGSGKENQGKLRTGDDVKRTSRAASAVTSLASGYH